MGLVVRVEGFRVSGLSLSRIFAPSPALADLQFTAL